jgi:hypothetical protein
MGHLIAPATPSTTNVINNPNPARRTIRQPHPVLLCRVCMRLSLSPLEIPE